MNLPLAGLIDANVRCVKCGANRGECSCWIGLSCPKCGKQKSIERQPEDYPEAVRMEIVCPKCDDGDFHEPAYYDAEGRYINRDPNMTPNARNQPGKPR